MPLPRSVKRGFATALDDGSSKNSMHARIVKKIRRHVEIPEAKLSDANASRLRTHIAACMEHENIRKQIAEVQRKVKLQVTESMVFDTLSMSSSVESWFDDEKTVCSYTEIAIKCFAKNMEQLIDLQHESEFSGRSLATYFVQLTVLHTT